MAGNYKEDRFVNGTKQFHVYNFREWHLIDEFCYFSHDRITIPRTPFPHPFLSYQQRCYLVVAAPSVIAAGHIHGVKVLGTVIVEWGDGVPEAARLVDEWPEISQALVSLAKSIGFDGWLMNFESPLPADKMEKLHQLLKACSQQDCKCVWYDSLVQDGQVKWQNALNETNVKCFDHSHSMFLNYQWTPELLASSSALAQERSREVFAGIDVWGRGTYGGGGFGTANAFQVPFSCFIITECLLILLNRSPRTQI